VSHQLLKRSCRYLAWALMVGSVASCHSIRTRYLPPGVLTPAVYPNSPPHGVAAPDPWWSNFADERLNALVTDVLEHNPDLAIADLKLRAAQQQLHLAVINPTVATGYTYEDWKILNNGQPAMRTEFLSATVSYEVDLWGQLAALRDATTWEARATEQDRRSAAVVLIGTTIKLYYELACLNQRVALGEQSIAYAEKTLSLVQKLADYGAASQFEVSQAEQGIGSQKAAQTAILQQQVETRNEMTVLLNGRPLPRVSELLEVPETPVLPVDPGLPASLLGRRPDLQAAEMRLREAIANADATHLSFYPQITLTSSVGTASTQLIQALQNPVGTLAATLTAPILQFNQAKYTTAVARTMQEEASTTFAKTILQAMYDVDNALSARAQLAEEAVQLANSLNAARNVERISAIRVHSGAVTLQAWLDAQQGRRQVEGSLANNRLQRLENYVTLSEALGGAAHLTLIPPSAPAP
jgi:NodT family efflux transporter outer membrane factor (OMF) lipoprotein